MSKRKQNKNIEDEVIAKKCKISTFTDVENHIQNLCFQARVISKRNLFDLSKAKYFSFEVVDKDGKECRIIVFDKDIEKVYNSVDINNIYYFKNFSLNKKNETYNQLNTSFELVFNKSSLIQLVTCDDSINIPKNNFKFLIISEIKLKDKNEFVDLVCIIKDVNEVECINLKNSDTLNKRTIRVQDTTDDEIDIVLWNNNAIHCKFKVNDILALKNAKVGTYNKETYVSIITSTSIFLNDCSIKEVSLIKKHYLQEDEKKIE